MKRFLSIVAMILALAFHSMASAASAVGNPADACQNPGQRPLLTTLVVERASGAPNRYVANFGSASDNGLLCIENHGATSAGVAINGSGVVVTGDFAGAPLLIGRFVTLQPTNKLIATISGLPGQAFTVRIYGPDSATPV